MRRHFGTLALPALLLGPLLAPPCACAPPTQTLSSSRGAFRIVVREGPEDAQGLATDTVTIVLRGGKASRRLPPERIEGQTNTDQTGFAGDFHISPDGNWIFRQEKYVHTVGVGSLYRRHGGADFRPALPLRFDEAAWRFYAASRDAKRRHFTLPTVGDGPRIIDFVSWSRDSRRLTFRLRSISGYTEAQGWGWTGYYDTRTGRFGPL
jgi:hypothetical protein